MSDRQIEISVFDSDGALSRAYLLNRGYCCENGCRNCPYGFSRPGMAQEAAGRPAAPAAPFVPFSKRPRRIVSLCPSNTEILHALGLTDRVVGVDDFSDWPPDISGLPRLGPDLNIAMERVRDLKPDLVLASLSVPGMERNVTRLQEQGLPTLVLDAHSLGEIWNSIRAVAAAAGVEARGEDLILSLQDRIQTIRHTLADVTARPRFYWEWWPKPLVAPGGRSWLTPLSDLAGGINITGSIDAAAVRPSVDEVIAARPDFIFLVWTGIAAGKVRAERVRDRPGWENLPAVQQEQVLVMDQGLFCRPSPRLIDGLERLAALVHPEYFEQPLE